MPTRNVVLTQRHEEMIADLVASGRYQNASEVLREGFRLIEERDAREEAKLKALRKAAQAGLRDLDEGRSELIAESQISETIAAIGKQARTRR
jgi:antitoxin ParD1/3/4